MKILIDIGHPAHVHYFRNFISLMQEKGHEFLIVARDKEVTHTLLKKYEINYYSRGRGAASLIGKIIYTISADLIILKLARNWQPDIFLSFGSPYAAHISKLLRKPHIAFTDTEHAKLGILAFAPFTETIVTPDCFYKNFPAKQIRFKSYFELCYLSPKYFKPDPSIRNMLNIKDSSKVVLFRFISWGASHDIGQKGIPNDVKIKLVKLFEKKGYQVLISAEGLMSSELESYRIKISPEKIHDVLSTIDVFIGESGTMATEAAILGTPSIYVNSLDAGVFQDEVKYGLLYSFRSSTNLFNEIEELLKTPDLKSIHRARRLKLIEEKIDSTTFFVWFVENYPKSINILKDNPDYQHNFK